MAEVSQRRREVGGHEAGVTRRQGPTEPGGSFGSQDKSMLDLQGFNKIIEYRLLL